MVGIVHDPGIASDSTAALTAVCRYTPTDVPVVVVGLHESQQPRVGVDRDVVALAPRARLGETVADFAVVAQPADLVLISARCRPPVQWLERLRGAAGSDETVATVTPVGDGGGTLQVAADGEPEPDDVISRVALGTHPRVLIGGPHCLYIRRSALELTGGIPFAANSLAELAALLCEACAGTGMVNVVADDLYVRCEPAADALAAAVGGRLAELDSSDERSALQRALGVCRSALLGLTVTIDGRSLGPQAGGTQLYTIELILALARTGEVSLRVVVADDLSPGARGRLEDADGIEIITYEQAVAGVELSDVVHRPQQVFSVGDLNLLRVLGSRVVVTHQDLIAYHNPTYHAAIDTWEQYRRVTRIALAVADRVVFFSEHSRRDATAEDLVSPDRSEVIGVGLGDAEPQTPRRPARAPDGEFIVCVGPDYRHKNRRFAIELVAALRTEHGWPGALVLAGSHVPHGSSRADEQELLGADEDLARAVIDLGSVDDAEREWLFANGRGVLVPSVIEGFGLVPLEAARAGQPCLYAPVSSLPEVVAAELATLVPWSPSLSAARAVALLRDGPERGDHVVRLRAQAARWSWDELAARLVGAYRLALQSPHRAAAVRVWQELERERYLVEVERSRQELSRVHAEMIGHLGEAIALAGDDAFLTSHEQRGLLRVGSRPALARLVLWPFGLLGAIPRPRSRRDDSR